MADTIIIIPTYNEKENIESLISEIFRYAPDVNVMVVDDNSSDGTGLIADKMAGADTRISVLHRTHNRGRGYAGIDAFKEALKRKDARFIMEMDADFSHDPRYIPDFLKEIKNNDIVIGSRFVAGGVDSERTFLRNIISRTANIFIRKFLSIRINDCSAGYRCFKRHVIESMDLDSIKSRGPAIIEETLYMSHLKKYRIKEMPIAFKDRTKGKTKLNFIKLIIVLRDIVVFKAAYSGMEKQETKGIREFGYRLALAMSLAGGIMFYRGKDYFIWFLTAGSLCLVLVLMRPLFLEPVKKSMDVLVKGIGKAVNIISLLLLFYLVFTPVSIVLKLFGRDIVRRKITSDNPSYWVKRAKGPFSASAYKRMG